VSRPTHNPYGLPPVVWNNILKETRLQQERYAQADEPAEVDHFEEDRRWCAGEKGHHYDLCMERQRHIRFRQQSGE
jgi:hypothetical protein